MNIREWSNNYNLWNIQVFSLLLSVPISEPPISNLHIISISLSAVTSNTCGSWLHAPVDLTGCWCPSFSQGPISSPGLLPLWRTGTGWLPFRTGLMLCLIMPPLSTWPQTSLFKVIPYQICLTGTCLVMIAGASNVIPVTLRKLLFHRGDPGVVVLQDF